MILHLKEDEDEFLNEWRLRNQLLQNIQIILILPYLMQKLYREERRWESNAENGKRLIVRQPYGHYQKVKSPMSNTKNFTNILRMILKIRWLGHIIKLKVAILIILVYCIFLRMRHLIFGSVIASTGLKFMCNAYLLWIKSNNLCRIIYVLCAAFWIPLHLPLNISREILQDHPTIAEITFCIS